MGESIETPGMTFLRRLDIAKENKTTLFAFLYQTIQKANLPHAPVSAAS